MVRDAERRLPRARIGWSGMLNAGSQGQGLEMKARSTRRQARGGRIEETRAGGSQGTEKRTVTGRNVALNREAKVSCPGGKEENEGTLNEGARLAPRKAERK